MYSRPAAWLATTGLRRARLRPSLPLSVSLLFRTLEATTSPGFYQLSHARPFASTADVRPEKGVSLLVAGPTGVGKSSAAYGLALRAKGTVISMDSLQVFRELDIGTDKISKLARRKVPHDLIDELSLLDPPLDVVHFTELALKCTKRALHRDRLPILCGGSSFYIRCLLNGVPGGPPKDRQTHRALKRELMLQGWDSSLERLTRIDPQYAQGLCRNDYRRLARALGMVQETGLTMAHFLVEPDRTRDDGISTRCVFLTREREQLYRRIDARCERMLLNGLLLESYYLLHTYPTFPLHPARSAIGYRECVDLWLRKDPFELTTADLQNLIQLFQASSRNLARRQIQWVRNDRNFLWYNITEQSTEAVVSRLGELAELPRADFEQLLEESFERSAAERSLSGKEVTQMRCYISKRVLVDDHAALQRLIDDLRRLAVWMRS